MITCMRTTLILDDALLRRAKRRAAELGTTLSALVNDALRNALRQKQAAAPPPPFKMVTYGKGSPRTHHEPADFKRILEEEEIERFHKLG